MELFDQSGAKVQVPDEQVKDAILSGKYGAPAGTLVPIQKDDGTITAVPIEKAPEEFHYGATTVSQQDYAAAERERQYGSLGQQAVTGLEGAARGATFGLSDAVGGAIGGKEYREAAKARKEVNPLTAGVSELGGALAPALLTGGGSEIATGAQLGAEGVEAAEAARAGGGLSSLLSGAGKAVAAPTDLASGIGHAFESGVQNLVGDEAASLAGRIAQKGAAGVARGAAEGALYGAGNELSEESLEGNGELNGQKLLAAAGHGALLGGLGGGALSATGELASGIVGRAAKHFDGAAEEQATRALFNNSDRKGMKEIGRLAEEEEGVKGGAKVVGRYALDNGIVESGDSIETILPKAQAAVEKEGKAIGDTLAQADSLGVDGPSLGNVNKSLNEGIVKKLGRLDSLNGGAISTIKRLVANFAEEAGIPNLAELEEKGGSAATDALKDARLGFKQAQELRRQIDEHINFNTDVTGKKNQVAEALKSVRGTLEDELQRSLDKGDADLGMQYQDAKLNFAKAKVISNIVTRSATARSANRFLSPSDYGVGSAVGAGLLGAHAGPLGVVGGVASSLAHHYVREHGNSTAAVALDALQSKFGGRAAETVSPEFVDREIARRFQAPEAADYVRYKTRLADDDLSERASKDAFKFGKDRLAPRVDDADAGIDQEPTKYRHSIFSIGDDGQTSLNQPSEFADLPTGGSWRNESGGREVSLRDGAVDASPIRTSSPISQYVDRDASRAAYEGALADHEATTSMARRYVLDHGGSTAAVALDKLAQIQSVRRAAQKVDTEIEKGVSLIAEKGTERPQLHVPEGDYSEKRAKVAMAAVNKDAHAEAIEGAAEGLQPHAPAAASGFESAAKRAVAYLAAAMPPHPTQQGIMPSGAKDYEPPANQQQAFVRKYDAVNDPTSILALAHDGTLTADEIEAVRVTHPEVLKQMQDGVRDELTHIDPKKADAMPLAKKQALATLLGQPIDSATSGSFALATQQGYSSGTPKAPSEQQMMGAPKRKLDLDKGTGLTGSHEF